MLTERIKMSREEAMQYVMTSKPEHPVFQRALVVLAQSDAARTRLIAWLALSASIVSLVFSILRVH